MRRTGIGLVMALTLAVLCTGVASADGEKIVIAHRGASGYVPEHTLEAYAMAYAFGADYIEQDLVMTKDGRFICRHDIQLDDTTNVESVFPDRKRQDGHWYAADFTLDEIKRLNAEERLGNRFPKGASHFEVPSFEEAIELVQGLNKTMGREAGIYPELKNPAWHQKQGMSMEEPFLAIAEKYGYKGKDARIFVQCFEKEPLVKMRQELHSELPQIYLLGGGKPTDAIVTASGLKELAAIVNGIGPDKGRFIKDPDLAKRAHEAGLAVHPYTFRADDFPNTYANVDEEMTKFYFTYDVDGVFTDHADHAVRVLAGKGAKN